MASQFVIADDFMTRLREDLASRIAKATYYASGGLYEGYDLQASVISTGQISVSFLINAMNHPGKTVTRIMLYDVDGNRIGQRDVSITTSSDGTAKAFQYTMLIKMYQTIDE